MDFTTALTGIVLYMTLIFFLRKRRSQYIEQIDIEKNWESLYFQLAFVEFPFVFNKSLEFALFKTYGIPSISKILHATGEFEKRTAKRYDDTALLLREMGENGQFSDRGVRGLNRMNEIHSHYKISNEDYLYTLCLFVIEPIRWVNEYDWRPLTEKEQQIIYKEWHAIGTRMGIKNIPTSLQALEDWSCKYEEQHMKYAPSNKLIADSTVELFVWILPEFVRPFARRAVYALMTDSLREACGAPKQPGWFVATVKFLIRGIFNRFFLPPRPLSWAVRRTSKCPASDGRFFCNFHEYQQIYPDGYFIEKLGPSQFSKEK